MIGRYARIGLFAVVIGLGSLAARAWGAETLRTTGETREERAAVRQAIRNTPLLERPNRPGHFYGNTVRRINERRSERN